MAVKNESGHAGGFIISEAAGYRSRDKVTGKTGETFAAGEVLAVDGTGDYVGIDPDAVDGTETAVAIAINATDGALAADTEISVVSRDAEVNYSDLVITDQTGFVKATTVSELAAVGIIVRDAI